VSGTRVSGVTRSGIREIMELASGRADVIHLEVGEPDFETPAHVIDEAWAGARQGLTKYAPSRGLPDLRQALSDKLRAVNGIVADPASEIVVTAGAANGLLVTLAAVVDPGDTVLLPDPAWPNYTGMSRMLGLQVARYRLAREDGFQPDPDELARLLAETGARAVVINSPHNPTGAMLSEERLARIVDVAAAAGATIVSDECYDQIVLDEAARHVSPAALHPDAAIVTVMSFSKTYAMTGWRVGYVTAAAGVLAGIGQIQETWLSCVSAPVQRGAQAALEGDQTVVGRMVAAYRERRARALAVAAEVGLTVHPPSGAFYLMVDIGDAAADGLGFARDLVTTHGVAVAPGETFGNESRGMVRLSLAASADDIETGLRRLADAKDGR
jgi:aspartate aminotransferase